MKKQIRKLAVTLAFTLAVSSVPYTAQAAAAPDFKARRTSVYENGVADGVYTYTIKNVKKGYKVKWGITGGGKAYVKLGKKETKAAKTTVSNTITINTNDKTAAKNKKFNVIAKVYDSKGKLVKSLKDKPAIKVQATDAQIKTTKFTDSLTALSVGTTYEFETELTPSNSTSITYWSVTNEAGTDVSSEMTEDGKWTPTKMGKYTIKATVRNSKSSKALVTKTLSVTVGVAVTAIKQTGANQFRATFNSDVSKVVKADDFNIAATNGTSTIAAKEVEFSSTGKVVTVTNFSNFKDGTSYTITYGNTSKAFVASVGEVESAKILTETVQAGKASRIEYALYDENGIDVKAAAGGNVEFTGDIINGYFTENKDELFMTTAGKTAEITLTYTEEGKAVIKAVQTIRCVEAVATEAKNTNFTITSNAGDPDYDAKDYKAVTTVAVGDESAYAHFRAVDDNKNVIPYDSVTFASSNDSILIVDPDGRLTPIKTGNVKVVVTAKEGEKEATYTFSVNVIAKRVPKSLILSKNSVIMSNYYDEDYKEYIDVTVKDQHGVTIPLNNESCFIKENSNRLVTAAYDEETNRIVIDTRGVPAGTYSYKIEMTIDGTTVSTSLTVIVKEVPSNGATGYTPVVDQPKFDMVIDKNTTGDKTVNVRMKKLIGGVFAGYVPCNSATITKGGLYYSADLTEAGTKTKQTVGFDNGNTLILTPVKIITSDKNVGESRKAETGTYVIQFTYYDSSGNIRTATTSLTLTDEQSVPGYSVRSTTSSRTVSNALALVNDCVSVTEGTIESCTVTGTSLIGDAVSIKPGQKIHVPTITIRSVVEIGGTSGSRKVYVYHTINFDKTLTNRG